MRAAWQALRNDRWRGAMGGISGIHYTAVSRYAQDHGITGDAFAAFHVLLTALDDEYQAFEAERQQAEQDKREQDKPGPTGHA